ncbi:MAG: isoprenyl transferase [Propionibacteriaceae bacterium]|nr:isoprenyl transferase [Propionibacteriaceae bacterium]
MPKPPTPHPSGATPPSLDPKLIPAHVAIVMDGNGRWAKQRGLARTEGHTRGEGALFDVIEGAIEIGVKYLSVFAFSTENWRRSPDEVRWLLGFNRTVIHRRRDALHEMGVKVLWAGQAGRLWRSVIKELQFAEELSKHNDTLTFQFCMNYGGRAEIVDAAARLAADAAAGRVNPSRVNEKTFRRYLYHPEIPDVDLFIRSSGEQRLSNFQLFESAYAELVFCDKYWPDFDRRDLWAAIETFAHRTRRFGSA